MSLLLSYHLVLLLLGTVVLMVRRSKRIVEKGGAKYITFSEYVGMLRRLGVTDVESQSVGVEALRLVLEGVFEGMNKNK